jgi:hypothetical protein
MKTDIFSKLAVLLLTLLLLITVSCKKKISKEDLEYQVGQSVSEYFFEELVKQVGSFASRDSLNEVTRLETKVSLIKETENRYIGNAIVEYWKPDQHGGDGPGTKGGEENFSIVVIVDLDDGSFRWEMQN